MTHVHTYIINKDRLPGLKITRLCYKNSCTPTQARMHASINNTKPERTPEPPPARPRRDARTYAQRPPRPPRGDRTAMAHTGAGRKTTPEWTRTRTQGERTGGSDLLLVSSLWSQPDRQAADRHRSHHAKLLIADQPIEEQRSRH